MAAKRGVACRSTIVLRTKRCLSESSVERRPLPWGVPSHGPGCDGDGLHPLPTGKNGAMLRGPCSECVVRGSWWPENSYTHALLSLSRGQDEMAFLLVVEPTRPQNHARWSGKVATV